MDWLSTVGYIAGVIGFIATLVSAAVIVRSTTVKQTISVQNDLIHTLNQKVSALEKSDADKTAQITALQHEVDTFKNVPLSQIVEAQKSILKTQESILKLLKDKGV